MERDLVYVEWVKNRERGVADLDKHEGIVE